MTMSPVSRTALTSIVLLTALVPIAPALADVTSANDGTGTIVIQNGNRFTIDGGTINDSNQFHSFGEFNLTADQIATFQTLLGTENVLGRITGGDASFIHGLIELTGSDTNLFLMNPAGMIFGDGASLNVPSSFTATTATGIGFGDGNWFSAIGSNDYSSLVGNPTSFAFTTALPGSLVNSGDLAVNPGQSLTLLGGTVINTGTLTAPGGEITIAAIEGENLVRIGQENGLLSLELETATEAIANGSISPDGLPNALPFTPLDLPSLLAGGPTEHATDLLVNADGSVRLTHSPTILPTEPGVAIASNTLSTDQNSEFRIQDSELGTPQINILANRPLLLNATLSADSPTNGSTVRIGGGFQGQESVFNASQTLVDGRSSISANSLENGDGGRVIVWADGETGFWGDISATGGSIAGDGGLVEVSGLDFLAFEGTVDTTAVNGAIGSLLLDPTNIEVVDTGGTAISVADVDSFLDGDLGPGASTTINAGLIDAALADVTLQATNDITFSADVNIATPGVGLTAEAGNNITVNADITTNGGDIAFTADSDSNESGSFVVNGGITINNGGDLRLQGSEINLLGGSGSVQLDTGSVEITTTSGQNIFVGSDTGNAGVLDLTEEDLAAIQLESDTAQLTIGSLGDDGNVGITIVDNPLVFDGNLAFQTARGGIQVQQDITVDGRLNLQSSGDIDITNSQLNASSDIQLTGRAIAIGGSTINSGGDFTASGIGAANNNDGIVINTTTINTGNGNINLTGIGANSDDARGVSILDSDLITTSGNISITGEGRNGNGDNAGIEIRSNSTIETGTGDIEINGTGGDGTNDSNYGVFIFDNASVTSTIDGNIEITGRGGINNADNNLGINISQNSSITTTGSGSILLDGQGGTGSSTQGGVVIGDFDLAEINVISTQDGNIDIRGTGGTSPGIRNDGIRLLGNGRVSSENGTITFTGTGRGSSNATYGIFIDGGVVEVTDNGLISLNGIGGDGVGQNFGVFLLDGAQVISNESDILVTASDVELNGTITTATGDITVRPVDTDSTIGIGDGTFGAFNISQNELTNLNTTGTVTIGNPITVDANGQENRLGNVQVSGFDLTTQTYDLTIQGDNIEFSNPDPNTQNPVRLADNQTLQLISTGAIFEGSNADLELGNNSSIVLDAATGIEPREPGNGLDIIVRDNDTANIAARTRTSGDINIDASGRLAVSSIGEVDGISTANNGSIDVTAIAVNAPITADGTGNITLNGFDGLALNADIQSGSGDISINNLTTPNFRTTNVGTSPRLISTNGGEITITGGLEGDAVLTLDAGDGSVQLNDEIGVDALRNDSPLLGLDIDAGDVNIQAPANLGAEGLAIDASGEVAIADTVNIGGGGQLNITAAGSITTADAFVSAADIALTSINGGINVGEFSSGSSIQDGGDIQINAANDIVATRISTRSNGDNAGDLTIFTETGDVLITGDGFITDDDFNPGRLEARTVQSTGRQSGDAGTIEVTAPQGSIEVFDIFSDSRAEDRENSTASGNGGSVRLVAGDNITVGQQINTQSRLLGLGRNGRGGDIDFNAGGSIDIGGQILTTDGGQVSFIAEETISTASIITGGGAIDLSTPNTITLNGDLNTNGGTLHIQDANTLNIQDSIVTTNGGDFSYQGTEDIRINGSGSFTTNGANIELQGNSIAIDSDITLDSSTDNSIGGNISLNADVGDITVGDLTSTGRIGGNINVEASGTINTGTISTTGTQRGGNVDIEGDRITLDTINANNLTIADAEKVRVNGAITTNGGHLRILNTNMLNLQGSAINTNGGNFTYRNQEGNVRINGSATLATTGGDLTLRGNAIKVNSEITLDSSQASGRGGEILLRATEGRIRVGDINATGGNRGGNVDIRGDRRVSANSISTTGGDRGGNVAITGQSIEVIGDIDTAGDRRGGNVTMTGQSIDVTNINARGGEQGATVRLGATKEIITGDILVNSDDRGGQIQIGADDGLMPDIITTGDLMTSGNRGDGGNIIVNAEMEIETGNIRTRSRNGNAGDVSIDPELDIEVGFIDARGGNAGGDIAIVTNRFFRTTDSFSANGQDISISSSGGQSNGTIDITTGSGPREVEFIIGDSGENGTAGIITTGRHTFNLEESFLYNLERGDISLTTGAVEPIIPSEPILPPTSDILPSELDADMPIDSGADHEAQTFDDPNGPLDQQSSVVDPGVGGTDGVDQALAKPIVEYIASISLPLDSIDSSTIVALPTPTQSTTPPQILDSLVGGEVIAGESGTEERDSGGGVLTPNPLDQMNPMGGPNPADSIPSDDSPVILGEIPPNPPEIVPDSDSPIPRDAEDGGEIPSQQSPSADHGDHPFPTLTDPAKPDFPSDNPVSSSAQDSSQQSGDIASSNQTNDSDISLSEAQAHLRTIEQQTGIKPALIYAVFTPNLTQHAQTVTVQADQQVPNINIAQQTNEDNSEDQLELLLVTSSGEIIRRPVLGTDRANVTRAARRFRNTLTSDDSSTANESELQQLGQQLYHWLVEPLKSDLDDREIGNIAFLLDQEIRSIPIAALHDGDRYIIEQYSVGLMPSLSLTNMVYTNINHSNVLAMGMTTFDNADTNKSRTMPQTNVLQSNVLQADAVEPSKPLAPLPATAVETAIITEELWDGDRFMDQAATYTNLLDHRQQHPFGIVHLSTHADFTQDTPEEAYIQLSDGPLRLNDIRELNWHNPTVELVVLSACNTAIGDDNTELGFAGFSALAGVKSTLASLWQVDDVGTLGLMTEFYQQLSTAPIKAEALRQAQLAMLRGDVRIEDGGLVWTGGDRPLPPEQETMQGNHDFSHPSYWAGFTMVGSPW